MVYFCSLRLHSRGPACLRIKPWSLTTFRPRPRPRRLVQTAASFCRRDTAAMRADICASVTQQRRHRIACWVRDPPRCVRRTFLAPNCQLRMRPFRAGVTGVNACGWCRSRSLRSRSPALPLRMADEEGQVCCARDIFPRCVHMLPRLCLTVCAPRVALEKTGGRFVPASSRPASAPSRIKARQG